MNRSHRLIGLFAVAALCIGFASNANAISADPSAENFKFEQSAIPNAPVDMVPSANMRGATVGFYSPGAGSSHEPIASVKPAAYGWNSSGTVIHVEHPLWEQVLGGILAALMCVGLGIGTFLLIEIYMPRHGSNGHDDEIVHAFYDGAKFDRRT